MCECKRNQVKTGHRSEILMRAMHRKLPDLEEKKFFLSKFKKKKIGQFCGV